MKRNNIGQIPGDKILGSLNDLREKMSPENPVISWEGFTKFLNLSAHQQLRFENGVDPFSESTPKEPLETSIEKWEKFYKLFFEMDADFSKIQFPHPPEKNSGIENLLIIVAKGITIEQIINVFEVIHSFDFGPGIEKPQRLIMKNEREATEDYAIYVPGSIFSSTYSGSDEEFTEKYQAMQVNLTFLEKLLLEMYTLHTTKIMLNGRIYATSSVCYGSELSDGTFPAVINAAGIPHIKGFSISIHDPNEQSPLG